MVKGVNRTVIEVRDTGSRMFEKIVFYVSPEYGNLSARALQKAAGELSLGLETYPKAGGALRKRMRRKRRFFLLSVSAVLLLSAIGIISLILL